MSKLDPRLPYGLYNYETSLIIFPRSRDTALLTSLGRYKYITAWKYHHPRWWKGLHHSSKDSEISLSVSLKQRRTPGAVDTVANHC